MLLSKSVLSGLFIALIQAAHRNFCTETLSCTQDEEIIHFIMGKFISYPQRLEKLLLEKKSLILLTLQFLGTLLKEGKFLLANGFFTEP